MIEIRKSAIHNKGIFSQKQININTKIAFFEGHEVSNNTEYSLTFNDVQIEPTGILKHLNHSCAPNAAFEGRWLVSKKEILQNEEITIDYLTTEGSITYHFPCNCRSKNCRKKI